MTQLAKEEGNAARVAEPCGPQAAGPSTAWFVVVALVFLMAVTGLGLCGRWQAGRWPVAGASLAAFASLAVVVRLFPKGLSRRGALWAIVLVGIVLRLFFVWAWPADSDVSRYVVEGVVQGAGGNPYRIAPDDPRVRDWLPETARPLLATVNHKDLSAAYPPLAELIARGVAAISPTPVAFKMAAAVADMGACLTLAGVVASLELPVAALALYAANPLVLAMAAGEGHLDAVVALGIALAMLGLARNRDRVGCLLLGVAAMVKYLSVGLVPFALRPGRWKAGVWAIVPVVLFVPFVDAGWGLFRSLGIFARHMAFGGPLVTLLWPVCGANARLVALGLTGLGLLGVWLTVQDRWRGMLGAAVLILAGLPTLYPWYFLLLAPLVVVRPGLSWWWLLAGQSLVVAPTWLRGTFLGGEPGWIVLVWLGWAALLAASWRRPLLLVAPRRFAPVRTLSVVVPTLNEADRLAPLLTALAPARERGIVDAVVVADGGSTDATVAVARAGGAVVVTATGGRGGQLAAGLARTSGDAVLMLHADAVCGAEVPQRVRDALQRHPEAAGGAVGMTFWGAGPGLRLVAGLNALRAALFGIGFGDQGQFFRRAALDAAGGFPAMALMEDVELALRLRAVGETLYLGGGVTVSDRRWRGRGKARNVATILGLFTRYLVERRLDCRDGSGWRYYRRYYGRLPHHHTAV